MERGGGQQGGRRAKRAGHRLSAASALASPLLRAVFRTTRSSSPRLDAVDKECNTAASCSLNLVLRLVPDHAVPCMALSPLPPLPHAADAPAVAAPGARLPAGHRVAQRHQVDAAGAGSARGEGRRRGASSGRALPAFAILPSSAVHPDRQCTSCSNAVPRRPADGTPRVVTVLSSYPTRALNRWTAPPSVRPKPRRALRSGSDYGTGTVPRRCMLMTLCLLDPPLLASLSRRPCARARCTAPPTLAARRWRLRRTSTPGPWPPSTARGCVAPRPWRTAGTCSRSWRWVVVPYMVDRAAFRHVRRVGSCAQGTKAVLPGRFGGL